jgi:hypothetical protein
MSTDYRSLCADQSERIAALEAQRETEKACILDIYEKLDRLKAQHEANWSRIVKLEEANHPAKPDSSPAPAGGLVERVADAIADDGCAADVWHDIARAAIHAVAQWFDAIGYGATASILRREV